VSGASSVEEIKKYLKKAGFSDIEVETEKVSEEYAKQWSHDLNVGEFVMAAKIKGKKK